MLCRVIVSSFRRVGATVGRSGVFSSFTCRTTSFTAFTATLTTLPSLLPLAFMFSAFQSPASRIAITVDTAAPFPSCSFAAVSVPRHHRQTSFPRKRWDDTVDGVRRRPGRKAPAEQLLRWRVVEVDTLTSPDTHRRKDPQALAPDGCEATILELDVDHLYREPKAELGCQL